MQLFPTWIKTQTCAGIGQAKSYEKHIRNCVELMRKLGFTQQARELQALGEREINNTKTLIARQSLRENGRNFLATSVVTRGIAMKALLSMAEQGEGLLKVYHSFDYAVVPQLKDQHDLIAERVQLIRKTYEQQKAERNGVWDRIYGMRSVRDMKLISSQVHALLEGGLTDQDRADFEQVSRFMDDFLEDVDALGKYTFDPGRYHTMVGAMREKYGKNAEIEVDELLSAMERDFDELCRGREAAWIEEFLDDSIPDGDADALNRWKQATGVLPKYLSPATIEKVEILRRKVDETLTRQKLSYIELLFRELSDDEKRICIVKLNALL